MARAGRVTTAAALTASIPTLTAQDVVRAALRQDGGKVTIGQVGDIQNLIPYFLAFLNYPFIENVYDQLFRLDHEVKLNPALAESYEISDDGLLITLKIRQGVTYHSGNPMTAEDVVANLEWARSADAAENLLLNNMAAVSEIRAMDESTVEIEFSEPAAYFESAMGLQPVVEPAFLEKMKSEASGTGAFMVQEWVPGDHLTMVKNPNYWNEGRPLVDEAEVGFLPTKERWSPRSKVASLTSRSPFHHGNTSDSKGASASCKASRAPISTISGSAPRCRHSTTSWFGRRWPMRSTVRR